jgi:hypothetical protein
MSKTLYLNDCVLKQIEELKETFRKINYEPTDIGIVSAALTAYKKMLDFVNLEPNSKVLLNLENVEKSKKSN